MPIAILEQKHENKFNSKKCSQTASYATAAASDADLINDIHPHCLSQNRATETEIHSVTSSPTQFGTIHRVTDVYAITSVDNRNANESTGHTFGEKAKQMIDFADVKLAFKTFLNARGITEAQTSCITYDDKSFLASNLCQADSMLWQNNNKAFSYPETSEKENSCHMKKCLNISFSNELSRIGSLNKKKSNPPDIDSFDVESIQGEVIKILLLYYEHFEDELPYTSMHRERLYFFFRIFFRNTLPETASTDDAFTCLSAALGWDNPKKSEYWKSLMRGGNAESVIRSLQFEFTVTKFLLQFIRNQTSTRKGQDVEEEIYEGGNSLDDNTVLSLLGNHRNETKKFLKSQDKDIIHKDIEKEDDKKKSGDGISVESIISKNETINSCPKLSHDDVNVKALSREEVRYEDETNSVDRTENGDILERGNKTSQNTSNNVILSQSSNDNASVVALSVEEVGCEDETNSVERTENSDNSDGLVFMNGEKKPIENLIENQANLETSDSKKFSKKSAVTRESEVMIEKNKQLFCEKQISLKNVTSILDCLETFEEGSLEEDPEMIKLMVPPPQRNLQDEKFRLSTFRGLQTQVYAAKEFARGGFYCEHDNVVVCYSCQLQHGIDDIVGSKPSDLQWHDHRCRHALKFRSIPPRGSNVDIVEEDGSCSDVIGDPPGQRSFYIPPGDVRMEAYRLSTFEQYPIVPEFLALPSFRRGLAKNGFYFTGFTDRVKCFSCGRSVDKWNGSDQIADQKWHKRTCSLKNGLQCDNVPIRFCFGDLLNTNAGHDTVLQQRNHNTGDIRTVRYPQDLPERVRQNGGSFNIGPGNEVQIQSGPVAQPRRGNADQPRQNVALNQISSGGHAPQPRGVPEPPREIPTWRMAAVASQDHRRFLTNLFLNRELDRITSYARWPSDRPNVPPAALAKTGFYYLGDMDRVQCFSCGGVLRNWSLDDNAEREHRAHFGGCHMVLGNEPSNLPIPTHPESSQLLAVNYPLRFPQNPHMRGQAQREQTFDRRWPTRALRVNVEEVAEAGFFYLGERDRVKCFYCNGGLQNWEFDDKPWDEHAKWFPNCQFLLRTKGQKFVSYHLAPNAQLARPIIARQDGSPLDRIGRPPVSSSRGHDIPPAERRPPTPPPTIIDPQAEMRERKERVKNIMRNSEVVKNVLTMGFSEQIVETLLIDRIMSNNEENPYDIYGTVSELLDDVMKKEEEIRQEEEERRDQTQSIFSNPSAYSSMSTSASTIGPAPGSGKYNVSYYGDDEDMNDVDMYGEGMEGTSDQGETAAKQLLNGSENTESIQSQMDKIEEERLCKICLSEVADMVFLPCSHMLCCMECTKAIKQCPVCRRRIERAIKTYVK